MAYMLKQKVLAQVHELMEKGMSAEEIAKQLQSEREKALAPEETLEEEFSSEIKTIAQALAFRRANESDLRAIYGLLTAAYQCELRGDEAFRTGEAVSLEYLTDLFNDPSYHWLLVEAPNGFGEETDGMLLGVSCFSTDGVSRRNGVVEGNLGSIRYFGVHPRFHGLCVGLRLLTRTEKEMKKAGCCRSMVSIASTRTSLISWIERKGYAYAKEMPYPANSEQLLRETTKLQLFVKPLEAQAPATDISASAPNASALNASEVPKSTTESSSSSSNNSSSSSSSNMPSQNGKRKAKAFAMSDSLNHDIEGIPAMSLNDEGVEVPDVD